ncbi:hypothetical protein GCM10027612_05380 [Microbispora bryophytorum subsp. camponoti]
MQLHWFDTATPLDETLSALDALVHAGKVRYVGCCSFLAYQMAQAVFVTLGAVLAASSVVLLRLPADRGG